MSIKKVSAVSASALAAIALVGCAKEEAKVPAPIQPASVTPSDVQTVPSASAPALASTGTETASSTGTESTASSGTVSATRTVEFAQPYDIGSNKAVLKGRMVLENGIVKSVEVPEAKGPQATFAEGVGAVAYGKPVKGLQIDTVSGASLTSAAFNEFLKTVD